MVSDSVFHWARVAAPGRNFATLGRQLEEVTVPAVEAAGGGVWALANALFGMWNHEVVLVTAWPAGGGREVVRGALPEGASVVEEYEFVATVRPGDTERLSRPGVYVHRLFAVDRANVERFVELSDVAWNTFENTDDYAAQPRGLFRQREHPETDGLMLLVTWYDRLESWERSRTPPAEAAENFRERAMITRRSIAYPTRLLGTNPAPRGMGAG